MKKIEPTIFDFPRRGTLPLSPIGAFLPCKNCLSWQSRGIFFCIPFLAIVVRSVTTEVVTLRLTLQLMSPPIRDG